MTWNVKTGARDRRGADRLDAVLAVLRRERPDVLLLQELRGFDARDGRRLHALTAATGLVAHLSPSLFGQPVAVLARPPLRLRGTRRARWQLHHAAASAVVDTAAGPLTVVSCHLNPFTPYRRLREARWLAARYAPARRGRVVLGGDLNGLDPGTDHTAELARFTPAVRPRHLAADGTADTRAVAAFTAAGFVDVWAAAGTGDGRTAPTSAGGGPEFSGNRLDYLLTDGATAAAVRAVRVVRGDETEYASDHHPVVADLG